MGAFDPNIFVNPAFDEFLSARLLSPRELEILDPEQLAIVRANVRSEILTSEDIHAVLSRRVREVVAELMGETQPPKPSKPPRPGGVLGGILKPPRKKRA